MIIELLTVLAVIAFTLPLAVAVLALVQLLHIRYALLVRFPVEPRKLVKGFSETPESEVSLPSDAFQELSPEAQLDWVKAQLDEKDAKELAEILGVGTKNG